MMLHKMPSSAGDVADAHPLTAEQNVDFQDGLF